MKKCIDCGSEHEIEHYIFTDKKKRWRTPYCKLCRNRRGREWYKKNKDRACENYKRYYKRTKNMGNSVVRHDKQKRNGAQAAMTAVYVAKDKGYILPFSEYPVRCFGVDGVPCGGMAEQWDHRDYNKPLDVEPVCRSCNMRRGPAKPLVKK